MDGRLKNERNLINRFEKWLSNKLSKDSCLEKFYADTHIDMFCKVEDKKEWLNMTFMMYKLLQEGLMEKYPDLELGVCFTLSTTYQSNIPKTFTLRNFRKGMIVPPELMVFNKKNRMSLLGLEHRLFLPEISIKYKMKAYYYENKEDVIWRWIYFVQ